MSWVAVGVTAAGVVKGTLDAKAAKKKQAKHDAFRKAAIQYSPWTGMGDVGAGNFGNTDAMSGALGGGLQGFAMGSSINSMAGAGGKKKLADIPKDSEVVAMNYQPQSQGKSPWEGLNKNLMGQGSFGRRVAT